MCNFLKGKDMDINYLYELYPEFNVDVKIRDENGNPIAIMYDISFSLRSETDEYVELEITTDVSLYFPLDAVWYQTQSYDNEIWYAAYYNGLIYNLHFVL